jgi:uncharacterized phage-associated protein
MSPIYVSDPSVDLTKLRALTLCIAERAPDIGVTKLEKLLYLCDFEAIRKLGNSISSDTYKNFQWGPVPKHFKVAFNELISEGKLTSTEKAIGPGISFNEIKPIDECPSNAFTQGEWEVINRVLEEYGHLSGKVLVKLTHDQLPYRMTLRNEEIPDFLAHYVDHQRPTLDEINELIASEGYLDTLKGRLSVAA